MPNANVITAMSAKMGFLTSIRKPNLKSYSNEFI